MTEERDKCIQHLTYATGGMRRLAVLQNMKEQDLERQMEVMAGVRGDIKVAMNHLCTMISRHKLIMERIKAGENVTEDSDGRE